MFAIKPIDFRKGAKGLATLVREAMTTDPFSGTVCGRTRSSDLLGRHRPLSLRRLEQRGHVFPVLAFVEQICERNLTYIRRCRA
jgi:hypothetical protein